MKKNYISILLATFTLLLGLFFTSCSNLLGSVFPDSEDVSNNNNDFSNTYLTQEEAINRFGKVSKIYSAPSKGSRYYTGQTIRNFFGMSNNIVFEGNLVEYDSLDPKILQYIEHIENQNALMHQGYGDIKYISGKTYVELSSYKDIDNDKIIMFEVRIFDGDFWNHRNEEGWYAKSVLFSPDFKIDVYKGINIETGKPASYTYPFAVYNNNSGFNVENYNSVETQSPDSYLPKLGDINKIYKNVLKEGVTDDYQPINDYLSHKENLKFDSYLVEFNTVNPIVESYSNDINNNSKALQEYNVERDPNKTYAEYSVYTGCDTKEIQYYEIRFLKNGYESNNVAFKVTPFMNFIRALDANLPYEKVSPLQTITTNKMKNLGDFINYYDRFDARSFVDTSNTYTISRMFEYSSLSKKTLDTINLLDNINESCLWTKYSIKNYDSSKRYIELLANVSLDTNEIVSYQIRVKNTTDSNATSFNISLAQFDIFTDPNDPTLPSLNSKEDVPPKKDTSDQDSIGPAKTYEEAIAYFGDANKVYENKSTIHRIRHYFHWQNVIEYEERLVEYNSLTPSFKKYIDQIEYLDGYAASYTENDFVYNPTKIYAQIACYRDLDNNGDIVHYEFSLINGNPSDFYTERKDKQITLSPDLSIDIFRTVEIETGKSNYWHYPNRKEINNNFDPKKYDSVITTLNDPNISKIGNVNKVYKNVLKKGLTETSQPLELWYSSDEDNIFESHMIEYNSIVPFLQKYIDTIKLYDKDISFRRDYNIPFDSSKIYIEYLVYTGVTSKRINFVELRIRQQDGSAKKYRFTKEEFDDVISAIDSNISFDEKYPYYSNIYNSMKNLGDLHSYYDNFYYFRDGDNFHFNRLFEYNSLSDKTLKQYEILSDTVRHGFSNAPQITHDNSKRYIAVYVNLDKKYNIVSDYLLEFKAPNSMDVYSVYMTEQQFSDFTDPSKEFTPVKNH